jgi:hypothetical protein
MPLGELIHRRGLNAEVHASETAKWVVVEPPACGLNRRASEVVAKRTLHVRAFVQRDGLVQGVAKADINQPDPRWAVLIFQPVYGEGKMVGSVRTGWGCIRMVLDPPRGATPPDIPGGSKATKRPR